MIVVVGGRIDNFLCARNALNWGPTVQRRASFRFIATVIRSAGRTAAVYASSRHDAIRMMEKCLQRERKEGMRSIYRRMEMWFVWLRRKETSRGKMEIAEFQNEKGERE